MLGIESQFCGNSFIYGHALYRLRDGARETIAEAVAVHGEDLDALLKKLNEGLED